MTPLVHEFIRSHADKLQGNVLEIGSLDVNGGIRDIVPNVVGVDMRKGRGVDLVCPVEDLGKHFRKRSFDACVSTETLEHVKDWKAFVRTTWDMVKENGWLVITMASKHKGKHSYPDDYWRLESEQIAKIYPTAEVFELGKPGKKPTSIGWAVQKKGELGSLDIEPIRV